MNSKEKYYPVRSFDNLDPLIVDHGYLLCLNGKHLVSVSHECHITSVLVNGRDIAIELLKETETTPPKKSPIAIGTRVVLKFLDAKAESVDTNLESDKLEEAVQLYDLVPVDVPEDEQNNGYEKALEVDAWDDGKYIVYYKSAIVDFITK